MRNGADSACISLWFPLATTIAAAAVLLWIMPNLLGAPLGTVLVFQPDVALVLIASAVMGLVWALFRLGVAYGGHRAEATQSDEAVMSQV